MGPVKLSFCVSVHLSSRFLTLALQETLDGFKQREQDCG